MTGIEMQNFQEAFATIFYFPVVLSLGLLLVLGFFLTIISLLRHATH